MVKNTASYCKSIITAGIFVSCFVSLQYSPVAAQTAKVPEQELFLFVEAGQKALAAGRYDQAIEAFEAVLDSDPKSLEALAGKARALANTRRTDSALLLIEKISPAHPKYMLEHAAIYLLANQPEKALAKIDLAKESAANLKGRTGYEDIDLHFERQLVFMRGEALYAVGGYDLAMEEFKLSEKLGSGAKASRAIGDTYTALGQFIPAEKAFTRAVSLRQHDGSALRKRADIRRRLGRIDEALEDYGEALLYTTPGASQLAGHASALRQAGENEAAVSELRRLLKLTNEPRSVRYHLAATLIDANRPHDAERHLNAIGEWPEKSVALMFQRGRMHLAFGEAEKAAEYFRAALKQRPNDPNVLYNNAVAALEKGNIEEGTDYLSRAAIRAPADAMIRGAIGRVKLARGEDREALAFFNAAVKARPADNEARIQRAGAFLALGRPDLARSDTNTILKSDPSDLHAVMFTAQAELALGNAQQALMMTDALRNSATYKARGFLLRARALTALNNPDEALAALEQAKNNQADLDQIAIAKGDAYMAAGRAELARAAYHESVALTRNAPATLAKRGEAYYALGLYELAEADFSDALGVFRDDKYLMLKRGLARRALNRCEDAITDFDTLLASDPSNAEAEKARGYCRIESGKVFSGISDVVSSWF